MKKAPSERIESIVRRTYNKLQSTARMWKVLDGLFPKHLELCSSWDYPNCLIKPLNRWNTNGMTSNRSLSVILTTTSSFSVHQRFPLEFLLLRWNIALAHYLSHLKHLRALENGSCDTFCYGVDNVPKALEVLEIESTDDCDLANGYDRSSESRVQRQSPGISVG